MGFIEDAQAVVRGEVDPEPAALPEWVDLQRCRRALRDELRLLPNAEMRSEYKRWSAPGTLERFVASCVSALLDGIVLLSPAERGPVLLDGAVRYALGGGYREELDQLERLETRRVVRAAQGVFDTAIHGYSRVWCTEMGFLRADGISTPTGVAFCQLRGRSALHFVLEIGVQTSLGWKDPVRVARSVLTALRQGCLDDQVPDCLLLAFDLGIVEEVRVPDERLLYRIFPGLEPLIDTVLSEEPNPIRALAASLLAAEVGELRARTTGAPPPSAESGYSRLVIHELNNALLPLGTALNRLWTTLGQPGPPDPTQLAPLRERIDRQVERLQRFATDSARLLEATTPETFPLATVVEEAQRETEGERNGRISVNVAIDAVSLEGSRGRWVLCFVNLFRNAAQARAGKGLVRVSTEWDATGRLHVYVDDDGPGVPEELRDRIFEQGVSQRGGTGLGLFEARTTVRLAGGAITCEESPLGGARFHIHVPARRLA